jgi:hypothetical protein
MIRDADTGKYIGVTPITDSTNTNRKIRPNYTRIARRVGPYSDPHNLVRVDGRTKEAALVARVRDDLIRYVGGNPNVVQRSIIERCVWLSLRLALLDKKLASGRDFTECDSNTYLAWVGSLRRSLVCLKPANGSSPPPNGQLVNEIMAEIAAHDR